MHWRFHYHISCNEKLNEIPLTELIKNVLYDRSEKQKEHLLHMLEEMAKGMDRLI